MARKKVKAAADPELVAAVRNVSMFSRLSDNALQQLVSLGRHQQHAPNTVIVSEGDEGDSLYVVLSGEVRVSKWVDREGGETITIGTLQAGDLFGEMALFERMPRTATVVAHKASSTFNLSREDFDALLAQELEEAPVILRDFISLLSHRLRDARNELRVVFELSEVVSSIETVVALGDQVLEKLLKDIPEACSGVLVAWPEFSDEATVVSARHLPAPQVDSFGLPVSHALAADMERMGGAYVLHHVPPDHILAWVVGHDPEGVVLVAPMIRKERLLGFIALGARGPNRFSSSDTQLMSIVANQVAISFVHALQQQDRAAQEKRQRVYYGQTH